MPDLIARIDRQIAAGRVGYRRREDLIRDAIEAFVLELEYEPAPDINAADEKRGSKHKSVPTIQAVAAGPTVEGGSLADADQPLFGLHNRDYPSIWALARLADLTRNAPIPIHGFKDRVVGDAWEFASLLRELMPTSAAGRRPKIDALFPSNSSKPDSASAAFFRFAVGECEVYGQDVLVQGPLFLWKTCGAQITSNEIYIGLTPLGYDLLHSMSGMSPELPHSETHSNIFLNHLKTHAPSDWWGIHEVIRTTAGSPTREELVDAFREARNDWSPAQAATYAGGYLARAREWGLVDFLLQKRRYRLTEFGWRLARGLDIARPEPD